MFWAFYSQRVRLTDLGAKQVWWKILRRIFWDGRQTSATSRLGAVRQKEPKTAIGKVLVFRNWEIIPEYGQRVMLEEGLNQKRYLGKKILMGQKTYRGAQRRPNSKKLSQKVLGIFQIFFHTRFNRAIGKCFYFNCFPTFSHFWKNCWIRFLTREKFNCIFEKSVKKQ